MDIIEDFIARYRKEYDFYDQSARLVHQTLESGLQAAGIRAMVTFRAKSIARLEEKCRQRAPAKNYSSAGEIYQDIVDLAGVRVALYFPAEWDQVEKLILTSFIQLEDRRDFPDESQPPYSRRFSGYSAKHYRVKLKEASLSEVQKRYAEATVEIQVASVLMHAWAEVEHDLVYKPLQGELSIDEYHILDELNGLVMAGEMALDLLQRAAERRIAQSGQRFNNHYDLAAHILKVVSGKHEGELGESALGRMDLLHRLLVELELDTPEALGPYIATLHMDTERRPIADQIVDSLLLEDPKRYRVYEDIRMADQFAHTHVPADKTDRVRDYSAALGAFMAQWIILERQVREMYPESARPVTPNGAVLHHLGVRDQSLLDDVDRIRRLRNLVVHGIESAETTDLMEATKRLQVIIQRLKKFKRG